MPSLNNRSKIYVGGEISSQKLTTTVANVSSTVDISGWLVELNSSALYGQICKKLLLIWTNFVVLLKADSMFVER